VVNNQEYGCRLQLAIEQLHKCSAQWLGTEHVEFQRETVWEGPVEVFDISSPITKAKRCYAWSYRKSEEVITILELAPVTDAQSAVRVGMAFQTEGVRK